MVYIVNGEIMQGERPQGASRSSANTASLNSSAGSRASTDGNGARSGGSRSRHATLHSANGTASSTGTDPQESLKWVETQLGIAESTFRVPSIMGRPSVRIPVIYVVFLLILVYFGGPKAILPLIVILYFVVTSSSRAGRTSPDRPRSDSRLVCEMNQMHTTWGASTANGSPQIDSACLEYLNSIFASFTAVESQSDELSNILIRAATETADKSEMGLLPTPLIGGGDPCMTIPSSHIPSSSLAATVVSGRSSIPSHNQPAEQVSSCAPGNPSMMCLASVLDSLKDCDERCVFSVRKINKLGFKSHSALKRYFSQFGSVAGIYFLPYRYKPDTASVRPSSMAFIRMDHPSEVDNIFAAGSVHYVHGWPVSVQPFTRQGGYQL